MDRRKQDLCNTGIAPLKKVLRVNNCKWLIHIAAEILKEGRDALGRASLFV